VLWWWSVRQRVEVERWLSTREGGCRRTSRCRACVLQVDTSVIDVPWQQWLYIVGGESLEGVKMGVRPRRPGLA